MISFYDLDCIIGLNEKRQTEYLEAYHKTQDKYAHLIILYSFEVFSLMPVVQSLFFSDANCNWLFHLSFYLYATLFLVSIVYSIRLLTPSSVYWPLLPEKFYSEYRKGYEKLELSQHEIGLRLKTSYLDELKYAVGDNHKISMKKFKSIYTRIFSPL